MYTLDEPIVAISSAPVQAGVAAGSIVRLSGPGVMRIVSGVLSIPRFEKRRGIHRADCVVDGMRMEVFIYCFPEPHSYTGQEMVELHITAAGPAVERLYEVLLSEVRAAGPGEFTWRAYANGRMDLTQAEAVAQIVSGANAIQLRAAEKLLEGNLSGRIASIREQVLDLLSLLEAGMDFSQEQIELISLSQATERLLNLCAALQGLLDGAIQYERMLDLPAAGLAGTVNAGKSRLLNTLLGRDRSIVSDRQATTRDVLSEVCGLGAVDCVLFDCAGLSRPEGAHGTLDTMAQQAARSSLGQADCVIYCVDAAAADWTLQKEIARGLKHPAMLGVLTKCDLLKDGTITVRQQQAETIFGFEFVPTSAVTGLGIETLRQALGRILTGPVQRGDEPDARVAVNQRHRQILTSAVKNLSDCADEIQAGREEIASMLLRETYQRLGGLEREDLEETVLARIFSRFCIGK